MQASPISVNLCSLNDLAEIDGKLNADFEAKLIIKTGEEDKEEPKQEQEDEEVEEEFSFVLTNPDGSPVSADQAFQNGLIRPMYPLFNQDLLYVSGTQTLRPPLKKLFIEERDSDKSWNADVEGPYCSWSGKAVDASPEPCKKSNSTGFSKLRRFRELVLRSNSDGKDAFMFFHHNNPSSTTTTTKTKNIEKSEKKENVKKKTAKVNVKGEGKDKTAPSAHEQHYVKNKAMKEGEKHRSYLPYRVGVFTSVNGMSRNVHPF